MDDKKPEGRPTKYKPEYCDEIINAAKQGFSLTAFAGMIGVCRDTINEWRRVHPAFSDACKRHAAARTHKLETDLLSAESGPQVTSRIFALKNAAPDEWRDKHHHDMRHSGAIGSYDLSKLNDDDLAKLEAILSPAVADIGGDPGGEDTPPD